MSNNFLKQRLRQSRSRELWYLTSAKIEKEIDNSNLKNSNLDIEENVPEVPLNKEAIIIESQK
jgi:hypothetical protein